MVTLIPMQFVLDVKFGLGQKVSAGSSSTFWSFVCVCICDFCITVSRIFFHVELMVEQDISQDAILGSEKLYKG